MADRGSYPHPVLDHSDDVQGEFRLTAARVDPSPLHVDLEFTALLDNAEIRSMLDAGDVALRARWRCTATMATGGLDLTVEPEGPLLLRCTSTIDQDEIDGRVEVTVLIVSTAAQDSYTLRTQNRDYGSTRFELSPGHVIADAGTFAFDARKSFDPMRPPIESCFEFKRKPNNRKFVDIDTSGVESVTVYIPAQEFDLFSQQSSIPEIQISTVVLPALMQAVVDMTESPSADEGGWQATLQQLIEEKGLAGRSPLIIAQSILEDPIRAGFARLDRVMDMEDDE